jgi:hypothetical protein
MSTVDSPRVRLSCCALADFPPIAKPLTPAVAAKQQSATALRDREQDAFMRCALSYEPMRSVAWSTLFSKLYRVELNMAGSKWLRPEWVS